MFFKKKGKIRKLEDQLLIEHIEELKEKLMNQTWLVQNSVDPSEEVILNYKITEAKFLFLIREAKIRNASMGKSK